MTSTEPQGPLPPITFRQWLVIIVAIIGFAFDTYELLMLPVISLPALSELLQVPIDNPIIRDKIGLLSWITALVGGIFGLLGGWLIDRFGRKRVLVWSILIYGFSPLAAAFSTSFEMFLFFRCTTFIGVCVEFVAAVAWLAELFPEPRRREMVLGVTQAFSSFGGLMVTYVSVWTRQHYMELPAISVPEPFNQHAFWRYTLISGLIPAIPILLLLPFLPESPIWKEKKAKGTLTRPSVFAIFHPTLLRTTIVSTLLFACAYGIAFGAIQLNPPQISPGVKELAETRKELSPFNNKSIELNKKFNDPGTTVEEKAELRKELAKNRKNQQPFLDKVGEVKDRMQFWQELAGLFGRIALAVFAVIILSRRNLLRIFLIPGLLISPYIFWYGAEQGETILGLGVAAVAFCTIAQFSYWGNYLPAAYPVHLRGTAGGFAANVGGRMIGTFASVVTINLVAPFMPAKLPFHQVGQAAAIVATTLFVVALILSFFLPEPKPEKSGE